MIIRLRPSLKRPKQDLPTLKDLCSVRIPFKYPLFNTYKNFLIAQSKNSSKRSSF